MRLDPFYNTPEKEFCALANNLEQHHSTPFARAQTLSGRVFLEGT